MAAPASSSTTTTTTTTTLAPYVAIPLYLLVAVLLLQPAASTRQAPLPLRGGLGPWAAVYPPTCGRIECPAFDLVDKGNGYEVRRYNSTAWMSTAAIEDISLVEATRAGFLQLLVSSIMLLLLLLLLSTSVATGIEFPITGHCASCQHLRSLLYDLGVNSSARTPLYHDNRSALQIKGNFFFHE